MLIRLKKSRYFLANLTFLATVIQYRYGYTSGTNDHNVLSPLGIQRANPSAFKNDFFIANADQPHIFFDYVTFISYKYSFISLAYLLVWLLALSSLALAITIFIELTGSRFRISGGLYAVLAFTLGPIAFLGTTTVALPIALPHALGGSLLILGFALILKRQHELAGLAVLLTCIAHVQIGAIGIGLLCVSMFTAMVFEKKLNRSAFIILILTIVLEILILKSRSIVSISSDMAKVCLDIIPYHCEVDSWKLERLFLGLVVFALLLTLTKARVLMNLADSEILFIKIITIGLTLVNSLIILADYIDLPFIGLAVKQFNAFRIGVLSLSLAAIAIAVLIARLEILTTKQAIFALTLAGFYFSADEDAAFFNQKSILLVLPILLLVAIKRDSEISNRSFFFYSIRVSNAMKIHVVPISLAVTIIVAVGIGGLKLDAPNLHFNSTTGKFGEKIKKLVPEGETITANPNTNWVRLSTKRAVIVDCKYVPYGGDSLNEWYLRLKPLGGVRAACDKDGFSKISARNLSKYALSYSSKYLLLDQSDIRIKQLVKSEGWVASKPIALRKSQKFILLTHD